jgi:general secretion pathway protein A
MYEEYYGFTEKPFSLTPDPKYLFKSESHANAFELLQYAIRRREGFAVITGDIGTGKTTLCRALLEQIDRNTFTALVLNPFLSEEDLLKLILQDFGVVSREDVKRGRLAGVTKQELIDALYDFLLGLLPLHASAVLIIDEAQNLPMPVLEQIRILSNLETDKEKLLQIVLVGQLNLQPLLRSPQMRQLDQRVSIRYELRPLNREEAAAYVAHRLSIAGGSAAVTFSPKALVAVHRLSGGIPRLVNLICDRALLAGYSVRTSRILPEMVEKAAESLDLVNPRSSRLSWLRRRASMVVVAAGVAVALAVAGGLAAPALRASVTGQLSAAAPVTASVQTAVEPTAPERRTADVSGSVDEAAAQSSTPEPARAADEALAASPYAVMVASFPSAELDDPSGSAAARLDRLTRRIESLGYDVRQAEVDMGSRGRWRRVLVGGYASLGEARREATRLQAMREFGDARVIASAPESAGPLTTTDAGRR